jgi:hypothetical protein
MTTNQKPGNPEDEYFAREDAEHIRKLHAEELKALAASEREALRKKYGGRCANCGALMVPEQAGEVRLLHCPNCGGAFLQKSTWEFIHSHQEPHTVMGAVLNWFKGTNKP